MKKNIRIIERVLWGSRIILQKILVEYHYRFGHYVVGNYHKRIQMLKQLKDIHLGKRCFILGSGPSINKQDLSKLKNEILIGVNQSYLVTKEKYGFYPNYVCLSDDILYHKVKDIYKLLPSKILYTTGSWGKIGYDYDGNNLLGIVKLNPLKRVWRGEFSSDLSTNVYLAFTVIIAIAIPAAIFMGCKKIYLLGCDNEETGYAYSDIAGHKISEQKIFPTNKNAFATVNKYCQQNGIKIYNAGEGGNLKEFNRVEYERLFI
jgi:hypothetical protein